MSGLLGLPACKHAANSSAPLEKQVSPEAAPIVSGRVENDQEKSCRQFVQAFYDWYFDRLNHGEPTSLGSSSVEDVLRLKPEILSPRLLKLLREDSEAQARNRSVIVGLDGDPFLNAQDWEGRYWVDHVSLQKGNCWASVWGNDSGRKREMLVPELAVSTKGWAFVNFHDASAADPKDEENLIDVLMRLRQERSHSMR